MKKSKYLNLQSGNWKCTYAGVDRVQPVYTQKRDADGKKIRSKRAGHRSYYYIFERLTSDAKAMKMIRLGSWLLSVVSNHEMVKMERLARDIDPDCFMIVNRVTEVWGRGFSRSKQYEEKKEEE